MTGSATESATPAAGLKPTLALFRKRQYDLAARAALTALSTHPRPSPAHRARLHALRRASLLLARLHSTSPGCTDRLAAGWYASHLTALIDSNRLTALPSLDNASHSDDYPAVWPAFAHPLLGPTDCVLVRRRGTHASWTAYGLDGDGARIVPADALKGFPLDQTTGGVLYLKDRVQKITCYCYLEGREGVATAADLDGMEPCFACRDDDFPIPTHRFPTWAPPALAPITSPGWPSLDVFTASGLVSTTTHLTLRNCLDALARQRHESPAPMYHNIIDPNVGAVDGLWVPTEFDTLQHPSVEDMLTLETACVRATEGSALPEGFARKACELVEDSCPAVAQVRSAIPDLDPHANAQLYVAVEEVFEAALPLLAKLRLPALLLPGPLQAVVKAQRIVMKDGERYEGVWHEDGLREHVVAVVLYYYRVSPSLTSGAVEFVSKRRTVMGTGDFAADYWFSEDGAREVVEELPRCIVPVDEGTLLVFGNYAALHRVLPIEANGGPGSRDFLAFFVIDQKAPLPLPNELGPRSVRLQLRADLLREQLQCRGTFGIDSSEILFTTGNGCCVDVAWLAAGKKSESRDSINYMGSIEDVRRVDAIVSRLNIPPPVLGRGISFLAQLDGPLSAINAESSWVQHIIGDPVVLQVFALPLKGRYSSVPPEDGVCELRFFSTVALWFEEGLWTSDKELRLHAKSLLDGKS